jgi:hypothetical protein
MVCAFRSATSAPASAETVKPFEPPGLKGYRPSRHSHGGLLFPPERGEHGPAFELCKGKPSLAARLVDLLDQARFVISYVVDPGTDFPGDEQSRWRWSKQALGLLLGQGLGGKPPPRPKATHDRS